jgi:hypothetical protein
MYGELKLEMIIARFRIGLSNAIDHPGRPILRLKRDASAPS